MKNKGVLFVVSGPSGVGKGTLCREILRDNTDIFLSVSATTRPPRSEDEEGVTYYFLAPEKFEEMIKGDEFLEWAQYNGNYYGTIREPVERILAEGKDVILEIDVQGALKVRSHFPEGAFIFISPPSIETLRERLKNRDSESGEDIEKRIKTAERELQMRHKYNYIIVNDEINEAVSRLKSVMCAEKLRMERVLEEGVLTSGENTAKNIL